MLRPYIYLTPNITPSGAGAVAALGPRFPNAAPREQSGPASAPYERGTHRALPFI